MTVVNALTVKPHEVKPGDEMLFVVKAMVSRADDNGKLRYRIYRCKWNGDENDIPQGSRVLDDKAVAESIFPTLTTIGVPD